MQDCVAFVYSLDDLLSTTSRKDPHQSLLLGPKYGEYYNTRIPVISTYTARCTGTGADKNKSPFFRRIVSLLPDNRGIKVDVSLYKTASPAESPYATYSREYHLNSYRIDVGNNETTSSLVMYLNDPTTSDFGSRIATEGSINIYQTPEGVRNPWYKTVEILDNVLTGTYSMLSFFKKMDYQLSEAGGCNFTAQKYRSGNVTYEAPVDTYIPLTSANCPTGLTYFFRVVPNTKYDATLYFTFPPTDSMAEDCLADTYKVSCALADIRIAQIARPAGTIYPLVNRLNFDVHAAASLGDPNNQGVVLPISFQTTDLGFLSISVEPTTPTGAGTTFVNLAGIELTRRLD